MRENFDYEMKLVLQHEGGNDDDPRDPGGRTSRGILQREWTPYVRSHPALNLPSDVWKAPQNAIIDIYHRDYWDKMRCDELASGEEYLLWDYAINSGVGRAPRVAQKLLSLPATGRMDDATIRAIRASDPIWFIKSVSAERLHFLRGLRTWPTFGVGWQRRVNEVQAISLHLAAGATQATAPPVTKPSLSSPKAEHTPDPKVSADITKGTGGGIVATGAGQGFGGISLEMALAIGAAVIIAGCVVWLIHKRNVGIANNTVILPPGVVPKAP